MRKALPVLTTIVALCFTGCASQDDGSTSPPDPPSMGSDDPPPPPPPPPPPVGAGLTGRWSGSFTTDNALASAGDFTFDFTEDATSHAVTGPFTGTVTAGATGTAFMGTFTGSRADMTLTGTVAITEPAGVTGTFGFDAATITGSNGGDMIAGNFDIDVMYSGIAVQGTGGYTIARMQ